jgi:hypothetical protein
MKGRKGFKNSRKALQNRNGGSTVSRTLQGFNNALLKGVAAFSKPGVPLVMRVTLHYSYAYKDTTANPGLYDWVMKGNGMYDPDIAIGGYSATGLDNYANLYTRYKVLGSTCKLTHWTCDNINMNIACIIPTKSSTSIADAGSKSYLGLSRASASSVSCCYGQPKILVNSATTADMLGIKDLDDEGLTADTAADPTHLWYWHVVTVPCLAAANAVYKLVEIAYDVVFMQPKQLDA